jgi:hypothetical protein
LGLVTSQSAGSYPVYQWFKDGQPISGANSPTLDLGPVTSQNAGSYQVLVTDGQSSVETKAFDLEPVEDLWVVTSTADSGPGTLRDILGQANADPAPGVHGIGFNLAGEGPYSITLQSALPPITGNVCILNNTAYGLTVDGGGVCRPFFLNGGTLVLDYFTVANGLGKGGAGLGGGGGAAGMGGGLFMNSGSLTLRQMSFLGNQALGGSSSPGSDGSNGGGGGFGGDSPASAGQGADGGLLQGDGGLGLGGGSGQGAGSPAVHGAGGGGGGAARGGLLTVPVADWFLDNLPGGDGSFGGGGGYSVGPLGGGGGSTFGGGGGGSGSQLFNLPGGSRSEAGFFGGDGGKTGQGGGGGGMGGAIFLREGSVAIYQCTFADNHAIPGAGDETGGGTQALAEGKGGAVFIYPYEDVNSTQLYVNLLQAQTYVGNTATDLVEAPQFDNDNYYIAQDLLPGIKPGSPLWLLYQRYHQAMKLGLPWMR